MLKGAEKDRQTATPEGKLTGQLITNVVRHDMPNIVTRNGITTELYRPEWPVGGDQVRHMIHVILRANSLSAWHMHERQTDTIVVLNGSIRLVLFDDREESATRGHLNVFNLSRMSPAAISVPPGVWHGIQNLENTESSFINYFDHPYDYAAPDEWRLPSDTDEIPYRFS